jgi:hypothetical protein
MKHAMLGENHFLFIERGVFEMKNQTGLEPIAVDHLGFFAFSEDLSFQTSE